VGLGDTVRGVSRDAIASLRSGQRTPSGSWLLTVPTKAMSSMRSVHRAELHRALTAALAPGTLVVGAEAGASADGKPEITIDGQPERFDLVVAADGIRSRSRLALGLDTGIRYAGCTAWRGVTAGAVDLGGAAGETWGRGRLFGIVPLPDDRVYWFATLTAPERTVFPDEHEALRGAFAGWHAQIGECIAATPPDRVLRHDLCDLAHPLRSFVRGRTVLLGDAAHAMTPNLGQGAGQGIEDAATLTLLLRGADASELSARLSRYDELRVKRTTSVWRRSRSTGRIAQASHPAAATLRDALLRLTPGSAMGAASRRLQAWPRPTEGAPAAVAGRCNGILLPHKN
jgi:2-polyprenyl-6-methoxyphenol hydroxylase-like FAD-dependent oxidoreductase